MKHSKLFAALALIHIPLSLQAETNQPPITLLDKLVVNDKAFVDDHLRTPYSTESYSRDDIQNSGASDLSDFLNQNTTLSVEPNSGNPLSPKISMSGYGQEAGFENINIVVDGVSLNRIDLAPVQISQIPIETIKTVTILKGTGSVLYGNNASAGAVIIETNKDFSSPDLAKIATSYGSFDTTQQGFHGKKTIDHKGIQFMGAVDASAFHKQGDKKINAEGDKNSVDDKNLGASFGIRKNDTSVIFSVDSNQAEVFYPGNISLKDFEDDPAQDQSSGHSEYNTETTSRNLSIKTNISTHTRFEYLYKNESFQSDSENHSSFGIYKSETNTEKNTHKVNLKTSLSNFVFQYGGAVKKVDYQKNSSNQYKAERKESSFFGLITAALSHELTSSIGYRLHHFQTDMDEREESQSNSLTAYNLGLNYALSEKSSIFASFEQGYLLPNFDRQFTPYGSNYNYDIVPQESDTYLLGFKHHSDRIKLSAETFYSKLHNEIFLDPQLGGFGTNTNIDKTHKKGINLSAQGSFSNLSGGINYQFTSTEIEEGGADGRYNGNVIPTAPEHTFKAFAAYRFLSHLTPSLPRHSIRVSHKQNSSSYAASDFENKAGYMDGYQSTDMSYTAKNDKLTLQGGIKNLFEKSSGAFVYSGGEVSVYPTQYNRYFYVKADYAF